MKRTQNINSVPLFCFNKIFPIFDKIILLRPFEPTGMTTNKWKLIDPVDIAIDLLVPTQLHICIESLPEGHSFCGDIYIHVVLYKGIYYISDGHNRVKEAKDRGEIFIKARILIKKTMEIISGFEPVRIIGKEKGLSENIDVLRTSGHYDNYKEDLSLVKEMGIKTLRVGVPWHIIEEEKNIYNWEWIDGYMLCLQKMEIEAILDPLHHVSIPSWLVGGFLDEQFVSSYYKFFSLLVARYPYVNKYTIVNEPTVTTYFAVDAGVWYPFRWGKFDEGIENVFQVIKQCSALLQNKEHWYVEPAEYHYGSCEISNAHAEYKNQWRFQLLDRLIKEGVKIDVLGLDYYSHCEFEWNSQGRVFTSSPIGFYNVAKQYYERYHLPIALTETNIRETDRKFSTTDRQTWFKYMYKQCLKLEKEVPFIAFCWYPFLDSTDWCTLVTECNRLEDHQGIINLDRKRNEFFYSIKGIIDGSLSIDDVKSYPYNSPLDEQLRNFNIEN